jgi:hypothetical protein
LAQPGDVHLAEDLCFLGQGDELVGEAAVLQAVVQVDLSRLEAFPKLAVEPELVAVGMEARGLPIRVEQQRNVSTTLRQIAA